MITRNSEEVVISTENSKLHLIHTRSAWMWADRYVDKSPLWLSNAMPDYELRQDSSQNSAYVQVKSLISFNFTLNR